MLKVAYYGIQIKDSKPKFHSSFNPELYLYNFHRIDKKNDVVLCNGLVMAVMGMVEGKQCISTFNLPYLSTRQLELINQLPAMLTVFRDDAEIVRQIAAHYKGHVRFI